MPQFKLKLSLQQVAKEPLLVLWQIGLHPEELDDDELEELDEDEGQMHLQFAESNIQFEGHPNVQIVPEEELDDEELEDELPPPLEHTAIFTGKILTSSISVP